MYPFLSDYVPSVASFLSCIHAYTTSLSCASSRPPQGVGLDTNTQKSLPPIIYLFFRPQSRRVSFQAHIFQRQLFHKLLLLEENKTAIKCFMHLKL